MITAEDIRASINKALEHLEEFEIPEVEAELLKLLEEFDDVE